MDYKEVLLTQDGIDFIRNLIDDRQEALDSVTDMPQLSRISAQREIDTVSAALNNATAF